MFFASVCWNDYVRPDFCRNKIRVSNSLDLSVWFPLIWNGPFQQNVLWFYGMIYRLPASGRGLKTARATQLISAAAILYETYSSSRDFIWNLLWQKFENLRTMIGLETRVHYKATSKRTIYIFFRMTIYFLHLQLVFAMFFLTFRTLIHLRLQNSPSIIVVKIDLCK